MTTPVSVVILAAGMGTRMRSKTPKVLHRAGGLTLVEHVVRLARTVAEPENIVVVVGHGADDVRAVLAPYGVRTAEQTEQLGTGHAVRCARSAAPATGHLAILYGDAPLLTAATLAALVGDRPETATVLTAILDDPTGYGRILRDPEGHVAGIVEHKAATNAQREIREINSGIYCFRAEKLWAHIDDIGTNNPAGEFYLTDIVELLRAAGHLTQARILADPDELLGINTRVELAKVDAIFRARKVTELMLSGVTMEKPETITVDVDVTIGTDTIVESGVRLLGQTHVGADCRIGAGSILTNATVASNVLVHPYSVIEDSQIGAGSRVGPFARLRMHNVVGENAHIGNFVELKKTHLGNGAKANHLAYLGDAVIGDRTNVGAGTITCNYDGVHKHQTTIGEGVFVGSNSTLVAPVTLEASSYIAAGSVITEQVPGGALGIGRGRQINKPGWVAKKKG
ncbi:MAG: UDP-N-acetylglucosamine diphosphorylase/glucosamine-1-phosphate N-acetyltransferase [Acidobacteriia bacterium 12-62-4]|nr:MAG: UDP-N-acetylglucosamine diphosphorylase/glucosamine-1-phosphate N-acetyltransferase [Acidobacteriia bacterium 12-62-4]